MIFDTLTAGQCERWVVRGGQRRVLCAGTSRLVAVDLVRRLLRFDGRLDDSEPSFGEVFAPVSCSTLITACTLVGLAWVQSMVICHLGYSIFCLVHTSSHYLTPNSFPLVFSTQRVLFVYSICFILYSCSFFGVTILDVSQRVDSPLRLRESESPVLDCPPSLFLFLISILRGY